jgi:hypothetical protein
MTRTVVRGCIAAFVFATAPAIAPAQNVTTWEPIEKSMAALLNEGYQLQSTSVLQIMRMACGIDQICSSVPEGYEYTFTLARQGKWVICVISNPKVGQAQSRCRALN